MSCIIFFGKYDWFDCNIINFFQRFEKQHCETSIASLNVTILKVSKNRTSKVPVSLVGSPCFNIEKICVSIHLFIQAKVLKMWKTLQQGDWLKGTHISQAQEILKTQFPPIGGLQYTLLSQNNRFSAVHGEAIQIHHINKNHWVTSHSIGQEIMAYDSKFCGGDLSPSLMNQLAIIYSKLQKIGEKEVPM